MVLLEMAQTGQVNYLHRTTKEWLDTRWTEMESTALARFDPHLGLRRAIPQIASASGSNPVRNKFKRQSIVAWKLYCNVWGWILEAFYHAGKVVYDPHHRVVDALDRIEASFRTFRFLTTTVLSVPPHWTQVGRGPTVPQFGFVGLTAEFGVVSYIREKIAAESDYLSIEGADEDLISCLLLGPTGRGLSRLEYKPLSNTPIRSRLPCIQEFVFDHMAFNHADRFRLAKEIVDILGSRRNTREKEIPLAVRNKLLPLAERIAGRNERGWSHKELGQTPIVTTVPGADETIPYGRAVLQLLENYGIGQKSGIQELFKEWLEGKR